MRNKKKATNYNFEHYVSKNHNFMTNEKKKILQHEKL